MFVNKKVNRALTEKPIGKPYNIVAINNDTILYFSCPIRDIAETLNIKTQYINRILNGGAKTHKGWTFKYCKENELE